MAEDEMQDRAVLRTQINPQHLELFWSGQHHAGSDATQADQGRSAAVIEYQTNHKTKHVEAIKMVAQIILNLNCLL